MNLWPFKWKKRWLHQFFTDSVGKNLDHSNIPMFFVVVVVAFLCFFCFCVYVCVWGGGGGRRGCTFVLFIHYFLESVAPLPIPNKPCGFCGRLSTMFTYLRVTQKT